MEEELATSSTVDVTLNATTTATFTFRSTFSVDVFTTPTGSYVAKLIKSDGSVATSVNFTDSLKGFGLPDTESGQFFILVERPSTGSTVTIEGTVTINGHTIDVSGILGLDATRTYIDESDGVEKYWWTVF